MAGRYKFLVAHVIRATQVVLSDWRTAVAKGLNRKILIQNLDPILPPGRQVELHVERLDVLMPGSSTSWPKADDPEGLAVWVIQNEEEWTAFLKTDFRCQS